MVPKAGACCTSICRLSIAAVNSRPANIILVGPMGSGKTLWAAALARDMGLAFVDCDEEIERQTGASVNLIFDIEGEAGFRERESPHAGRAGAATAARCSPPAVAPCSAVTNRALLNENGLVVWLKTSVKPATATPGAGPQPPPATGTRPPQRLEAMAADTRPACTLERPTWCSAPASGASGWFPPRCSIASMST